MKLRIFSGKLARSSANLVIIKSILSPADIKKYGMFDLQRPLRFRKKTLVVIPTSVGHRFS